MVNIMQSNRNASQSEEDFEEQRQKYRDLLEELQEKADSCGAQGVDPDVLRMFMLKGNELFNNVRRPREAALDAQFMKQVSQLASLNIRSSHSSLHEFKLQEFTTKLKSLDRNNRRMDRALTSGDWIRIAKMSSKGFRPCYGIEPQFVGFEAKAAKTPSNRVPKVKDKEAAKTEMERVQTIQSEEGQTEEMSRIYGLLKKRFRDNGNKPICFYSFVVNPNSFVLTVENVFHTSFLVRDQFALLTEDENGLPVICPDKPTPGQLGASQQNKQVEVSFDVGSFNKCVKLFNIREPMIPPRPAKK